MGNEGPLQLTPELEGIRRDLHDNVAKAKGRYETHYLRNLLGGTVKPEDAEQTLRAIAAYDNDGQLDPDQKAQIQGLYSRMFPGN